MGVWRESGGERGGWGERGLGREGGDVSEKGGCCVLTPLSPLPLFSVPPHPHPPFPASSPPGYYFRAGTGGGKNMWHIYLPGGAWCGSAAQCVARSKTLYGTSTLYPTDPEPNAAIRPPFYGMLSSNSTINPPFYNWNLVRLIYCDGAGYSGTAGRLEVGSNGTVLYLDGWNIIQAVIEDLQSKRGIKSAAQILLSGSSAGGQAVVALCDRIAAAFPWAPTKCIADSGFFIVGGYSWRNGVNDSLPPSLPTCSPPPPLPFSYSKDRMGGYSWRNGVKNIVALHEQRKPLLFSHFPSLPLPTCSPPPPLPFSYSKDRMGGYSWRNGVKNIVALHEQRKPLLFSHFPSLPLPTCSPPPPLPFSYSKDRMGGYSLEGPSGRVLVAQRSEEHCCSAQAELAEVPRCSTRVRPMEVRLDLPIKTARQANGM
ncbi:unnamed protein product [Closterium sp. Naga37s-1]|nr:unnamed protein product [Closterium sp. Naga37s-1]